MKIGVIGSRDFKNRILFEEIMSQYVGEQVIIVSGGANGVDTWAEEFANKNELLIEVIRPINPSDKLSYLFRNVEIITSCDKIIAFWDGYSKGTGFVIEYCKSRGKPIDIYNDSNATNYAAMPSIVPQKPHKTVIANTLEQPKDLSIDKPTLIQPKRGLF